MIGLKCSACGCELEVGDLRAGQEIACPRCGQPVPLLPGSRQIEQPTRAFEPIEDTPVRSTKKSTSPPSTVEPSETIPGSSASQTAGAGAEKFDFLAPPRGADGLGWLAHYRIVKLIGAGGMGMVFLAEDSQLQRLVALKVVRPEMARDPQLRERFLREARAMAAVKSDYIVGVYQVGEENSLPFLAMEYLEGETLEDRLNREPRPNFAAVVRIARETALGLAAAHARGLIHRDIKPSNLFLEAPSGRVKILDFGLARPTDTPSHLTEPGLIMGTPEYMAPEQAEGGEVSERSDLFSLGSVLYRMLSGKKPFGEGGTMAVLMAVMLNDPPPIKEVNPSVPPVLADLTTRLLAKQPAARPTGARAVADTLEGIALEPTVLALSSHSRQLWTPPSQARRRRVYPAVWIATGLLVIAGLLGGSLLLRQGNIEHATGIASRPVPDTRSTPKVSSPLPPTNAGEVLPPAAYTLNGGGSTFIYPLMEKWASVYRKEKNVKINYGAIGSGAGIQQLMSGALDFCCSDAPMTDQQIQQARQSRGAVVHIPVALGGVVPAYNLPGIEKPLRFSGPVLAGIFLGEIKKWNDPTLREINPGVDLPDQEITVIHRANGSGTTYIFTDFLSKVSKDWHNKIGTGTSVKWPVGVGAPGNEGVDEAVRKRPGAIGYLELLYALQSRVKFGSVKNKSGNYVQASLESVVTAVEGAPADIPPDLRFSLTYTPGKDAYPICGCTWAILYVRQPDGKGQRLLNFLRWVTREGQEYNTDLFYARVPPSLAERVVQRLKDVRIGE